MMLNLKASLNRVCWQLIVILSCQVHVWCILLIRNALHENSSSVVTGPGWNASGFFAPSERTKNRVACKIHRLQPAPQGRLNAKEV